MFGEAKDWHGLRRFRLRRLEKVNIEALLIASEQNVKRLVAARDRGPRKLAQVAAPHPPEPVGRCRPHLTRRCPSFVRSKGVFQQPGKFQSLRPELLRKKEDEVVIHRDMLAVRHRLSVPDQTLPIRHVSTLRIHPLRRTIVHRHPHTDADDR